MGIQELMYGAGAGILLVVLIYVTMIAGRRKRNAAADEATRRNFDKA